MNPIVERISQYGLATEIIFKCPKCGTSFAILGDNEKYCHNCGTEISWKISRDMFQKNLLICIITVLTKNKKK